MTRAFLVGGLIVVGAAAVPALAPVVVSALVLFGVVFILSRRATRGVLGRRGDQR